MERIIQMQNWEIESIIEAIPKVKEQGFTAIQTSVFQGKKTNSKKWFWMYQPLDIAFVDSDLGTKEQFKRLCEVAHKHGLKIYVDIVLRHVAGADYDKLKPHQSVNPRLLKYVKDVGDCYNYHDRNEYTTKSTGTPFLDYFNPEFKQICIEFLDDLVACGADGFRLDEAKHYKLPEEGCSFLRIFERYPDKFIYGECIFEDRWLLDKYAKYIHVLSEGSTSDRNRLVAMIESHDTFYPESFGYTNRMDDRTRINEYRNLIQNTYSPNTLYFCRPFEDLWMSKEIRDINFSKR